MVAKRQEFSSVTRRLAWARANGRCEGTVEGLFGEARCSAPIDLGEFHYDHIDPEWISGRNDLDNCQVLCRWCHREKTKRDIKVIAKVKRVLDKSSKARTPRGRPMPGTKRSGLRKKLDGTVERR